MKNETTKLNDEGKILVSDCIEVVTGNYKKCSTNMNLKYKTVAEMSSLGE